MSTAFYIEFPRITAVELGGSARKPKLKRVVVGDLPEPRNDDGTPVTDKQAYLNKCLAEFVKEHKLYGGKQYLLVAPDAMRYRDIKLAFSDRRQIDRVLQFQVEGVIPNMPIEDLKIGYNMLSKDADGARLLVHAADKHYIKQRLVALEEAGCSIDAVDSHLSGTLNLGLMHPEFSKDAPPSLWLDFAGTTATVAVVHGGEVLTARVFLSPYLAGASGGTSGAEGAKGAAKTAQADAEQRADEFRAETAGDDEDVYVLGQDTLPESESVNIGEDEVADRIRNMSREELLKFLNRVSVEARRTLLMTNIDIVPERLVVSGLGDAGDQLATLLGNELALEDSRAIELMDVVNPPGKNIAVPDVGELSYLSGVALKGLGADESKIDFRYGDLAPGTLFDYAKTPLAFTATLVLLFGGIMFLISFTQARQYERDIEALRDQSAGPKYFFDEAYRKAPPISSLDSAAEKKEREYPEIPEDAAAEIRSAHKKLKAHQARLEGATDDNYAEPHPADEILIEILKTFERAKTSYDFALIKCDIQERRISLEYLASLSETDEERVKLGVKNDEQTRIYKAFLELVESHPEWFEGTPSENARAQPGPDGRSANRITLSLELKKIEPPKKAKKTSKSGRSA